LASHPSPHSQAKAIGQPGEPVRRRLPTVAAQPRRWAFDKRTGANRIGKTAALSLSIDRRNCQYSSVPGDLIGVLWGARFAHRRRYGRTQVHRLRATQHRNAKPLLHRSDIRLVRSPRCPQRRPLSSHCRWSPMGCRSFGALR
jgi:hypothetical protein